MFINAVLSFLLLIFYMGFFVLINKFIESLYRLLKNDLIMTSLATESKTYPAMLSLDDKNYILLCSDGKLKIHGSGLKGKHMPIICDELRDDLCYAVFGNENLMTVFKQFRNLARFPLESFQIRIYPSKMSYGKSCIYNKLLSQLADAGYKVTAGTSVEYVKVANGSYRPVMLLKDADKLDYKYYKKRLAKIAGAILNKKPKDLLCMFDSGAMMLEEFK